MGLFAEIKNNPEYWLYIKSVMRYESLESTVRACIKLDDGGRPEMRRKKLDCGNESSRDKENRGPKISGLPQIIKAFGFDWKETSSKRRGKALLQKWGVPYAKHGTSIYVYSDDLAQIRGQLCIKQTEIAKFLKISNRTLRTWLNKYPDIPVTDKDTRTPFAHKMDLVQWVYGRKPKAGILEGMDSIASFLGIKKRTLYSWLSKYPHMPIMGREIRKPSAWVNELDKWASLNFARALDKEVHLKNTHISAEFDYTTVNIEAKIQRLLQEKRPATLWKATRIKGITPKVIKTLDNAIKDTNSRPKRIINR